MYPETQELIKDKMLAGIYPGVVYQFMEDQATFQQTLGYAQIAPVLQPMIADLLFDVASLTKVVCTLTVMLQLHETKQIEWDQPLKKYLPNFENPEITLRHLLTHTSDIQTYIPQRDRLSAKELQAAYLKLQPGKDLGKKVQYTDAGTILLGFLIEEIFQKDVTEVFQSEVLQPLDMSESCFLPKNIDKRFVPTEKLVTGEILRGVTHDPKARTLKTHAGNAGLFSSLTDLSKFVEMYLAFGKDYLKRETIEELYQDQTPDFAGKRSLGWDLKFSDQNQAPLLFHTGYTGTFILLDSYHQSGFIFLSNRVHPVDEREKYILARDEIITSYLSERKKIYQK